MQRLADMPWQEEPWKSRYPELSGLNADPGQMTPAGNVIERNIQCLGKWDEIEATATSFLKLRNNLLGIDPTVVGKKKGGIPGYEYGTNYLAVGDNGAQAISTISAGVSGVSGNHLRMAVPPEAPESLGSSKTVAEVPLTGLSYGTTPRR